MNFLTIFDFILLPFYLLIIWIVAYYIKKKKIQQNPVYKYYIPALFIKIFGAIALCLVYTLYYTEGGDTTGYFLSSHAVGKVLWNNPKAFLSIIFNQRTADIYSNFTKETGYPWYWNDNNAFAVVRFSTVFTILGFYKYILTSILIAWLCFSGIWRIFLLFTSYFPQCTKHLAIAILFVPSVIFWGSGIMKDSFVISAVGWFVYSLHKIFNERKYLRYGITLLIAFYIITAIKPFVFYGMSIGLILWMLFTLTHKIKNKILKTILYPILFFIVAGGATLTLSFTSTVAGGYYSSMDAMLKRAVIIQDDLTRDYYGTNSFDIGKFDPTIPGIASKFPEATIAGLFRPFIWESRSVIMLLSGIENTILLLATLFVFFRVGPFFFIKTVFSTPYILTFSILFSIFFAFSIGLVTANFGALVRYKIPILPFYLSTLIIVFNQYKVKHQIQENIFFINK